MKVKLILPALLEATDPASGRSSTRCSRRSGSPALAGYLDADDEVELAGRARAARSTLDDEPDLVVMSVYITSA